MLNQTRSILLLLLFFLGKQINLILRLSTLSTIKIFQIIVFYSFIIIGTLWYIIPKLRFM